MLVSDITKFQKVNKGRNNNDSNNKLREVVITALWDPPIEFINDSGFGKTWNDISQQFKKIVTKLYPYPFDSFKIMKKGGRKNHTDFVFKFVNNNELVHEECIEFKHGSKSISVTPQYLNLPEKFELIPHQSYPEYFYDKFISEICAFDNIEVPTKNQYMKYIHQNNYDKLPIFRDLKDNENNNKKEKTSIVKKSIDEYLKNYAENIDLNKLNIKIRETQNKKFILWDGYNFHIDQFSPDEMVVTSFNSIKNKNTIILNSNCKSKHHLLLRWKNHNGILYPAWQIKLSR